MTDYLAAIAADLDREPCRCISTDRGTDDSSCELHGDMAQWNLDHPDGITDEEHLAMATYSAERAGHGS